jgi:ABC-type multidrug transport system fused ATPase/permease subunit
MAYARPDRFRFGLDVFTIVIAVVTNTAMIWLMGMPLSLIQAGEFDELGRVLLAFGVVIVVNQISQVTGGWLTNGLTLRFIGRVRNRVMEQILKVSFPVAGNVPKGDLLARLSNDIDLVSMALVQGRISLVSHVLTLNLYAFMLFWIDVRLALIALATTPIFFLQQRYFSPRKRKSTEEFLKANGNLLAMEEQNLSNLRGISSNQTESWVSKLHRRVFDKALKWGLRDRGLDVSFQVSFSFLIYAVGLLIVLLGSDSIKAGELQVGALVSFILYLGYLTGPVRGLAEVVFQAMGNLPAANRVLEVLDAQPVVEDVKDKKLKVSQGRIDVQGVGFAYPGGETIFKDVDLSIEGGSTVALVGPSGSGKSTFATMLMRFYDPQQGSICIDGTDIREVSIRSLRHNLAVVWQSPFLVNDTIRANLLMANPDVSEDRLQEALVRSHSWEFVQKLPDGLDTVIGAGGAELSGGEKQRLAITQAFLRDAPILILDEASSALDSEAEQVIVSAINELRADRTTLMIAHRYSSIRTADRVIYFGRDGTVTMSTHEELLEKLPDYRDAVEWQTGQAEH